MIKLTLSLSCTLLCLAAQVSAQTEASTLARLTRQSDAIAQLRVLQSTTTGGQRQVVFLTRRLYKGQLPATFVLTEPAGQSCGRALRQVATGQSFLGFLRADGEGHRLTVMSSRSLVVLTPGLAAHVRDLLRSGQGNNPGEQVAVLAAALSSPVPRIRRDAALTLALLPRLADASEADRRHILRALPGFVDQQDPAAVGLLRVAVRLRLGGGAILLF